MTRSAFLGVQACKLSFVTLMLLIATTSNTYAQAPEARDKARTSTTIIADVHSGSTIGRT